MARSAQGEDRSAYQRVTAWRGDSFGIVKATEALSYTDPAFAANWANLRKERKIRGCYHFVHPEFDAAQQARFFVSTVKAQGLRPGDMLVADVEILSGEDGTLRLAGEHAAQRSRVPVTGTLGAASIGDAAKRFLDETGIFAGPYHPILVYTNEAVGALLGPCAAYELWIAAPGTTPPADVSPWAAWRIWQYQFGGGPGGGDRDAWNGSRAEMGAWIASHRKPRRRRQRFTTWMGDGKTTLEQLATAHATLPSTIIRMTAQHGKTRPEFTPEASVFLNEIFAGLSPATAPVPEGVPLVVPGG